MLLVVLGLSILLISVARSNIMFLCLSMQSKLPVMMRPSEMWQRNWRPMKSLNCVTSAVSCVVGSLLMACINDIIFMLFGLVVFCCVKMSVDGVGLIFDGIEQILLKSVRCSAVAMCSFEKLMCCCFEVL